MKQIIKLTESDFYSLIKESIHILLNENNNVGNQIIKQCSEYKAILMKDFSEAQKAVASSNSLPMRGIAPSLRSKGYVVTYDGQSSVTFYSPSRLFMFDAHENYGDHTKPWVMSKIIRTLFPKTKNDVKDFSIESFERIYVEASNEIGEPVIIKPFKTTRENIDTYKTFTVFRNGPRIREKVRTFDNFDSAKKCAYEMAKERSERGRAVGDSTSRYYCVPPRDITSELPYKAAGYEYYRYDGTCYYFSVDVD